MIKMQVIASGKIQLITDSAYWRCSENKVPIILCPHCFSKMATTSMATSSFTHPRSFEFFFVHTTKLEQQLSFSFNEREKNEVRIKASQIFVPFFWYCNLVILYCLLLASINWKEIDLCTLVLFFNLKDIITLLTLSWKYRGIMEIPQWFFEMVILIWFLV